MIWYRLLLFIGMVLTGIPALAQVGQLEDGKTTGLEPEMHVAVDVMEFFKTPTAFKIADHPVVHWGVFHETLSANYKDMFVLDHIHN